MDMIEFLLLGVPMDVTRLSSKGQVLIPKSLRTAHQWEAGQELVAIDFGDGILLKPKNPFTETTIEEVAGCLPYEGEPKTLGDMEEAIRQGLLEEWGDRSRH